jgi:hypothetical protein
MSRPLAPPRTQEEGPKSFRLLVEEWACGQVLQRMALQPGGHLALVPRVQPRKECTAAGSPARPDQVSRWIPR